MAQASTREAFEAGRAYVEAHARPLDAALLRHRLGAASADEVLVALVEFQNVDGGFGHGLEPDLRSPASSAIATSVGLRVLARVGTPAVRPTVIAAAGWLEANLDAETGVWPIIGADVDQAPHAPWWTWSEGMAANWNGFRFNPTAEILAHLYGFRAETSARLLAGAEAGMRRTLAETEVIEGAYDLKCAARLAETAAAPRDIAEPLAELVRRSIGAHDPADAHLAVLELAPAPGGLFAEALADRIEGALDALIAAQTADGGWPWNPNWNWSYVDAKAGAQADRDWRGAVTREALEVLMAYRRVED